MDTQDVPTPPVPHPPGFDFGIYMAGYMHITERHVCKCTTCYSKWFFVKH